MASKTLNDELERESKALRQEGEELVEAVRQVNYDGIMNFAYFGLFSKYKRHHRQRPTRLTKVLIW